MRIYTTLSRLGRYKAADGVNFPNPQDRFLAFLHANAFFPNRVTFLAGMCHKLGMDSIGIFLYVLIGLTQQPAQKPNLPYLLDTSRSILVSSKQQGNQYGSSGGDYICRLSGTVQDRGAVPGLFIPAAVSERV